MKISYPFFYKELGKLLYAIAATDGKVSRNDLKELRRIVSEELVPLERSHDKFGTDSAYIAEFEFELLEDRAASPEAALHSFIDFVEHNVKALTPAMKNVILSVAQEMASSSHGVSHAEETLINRVKAALAEKETA